MNLRGRTGFSEFALDFSLPEFMDFSHFLRLDHFRCKKQVPGLYPATTQEVRDRVTRLSGSDLAGDPIGLPGPHRRRGGEVLGPEGT